MDKDITLPDDEDDAQPNFTKQYWLVRNKGVLTRVGKEFGFTRTFVHNVFHHKRGSADRKIEARLQELGAPGFLTIDKPANKHSIKRLSASVHHQHQTSTK